MSTKPRKKYPETVEVWVYFEDVSPVIVGHAITFRGIRQILQRHPKAQSAMLRGVQEALNQLSVHTNEWGPKLTFESLGLPIHCEVLAKTSLRKVTFQAADIPRFWLNVDTSAGPDACWPWTGRVLKGSDLRGTFDVGPTWLYAHRCAYFLENGHWPEPQANHTCDNSICCNPKHIYGGTSLQNAKDRDSRHRRQAPSREKAGQAKLTEAAVSEIRRVYQTASARGRRTGATALAKRFGVHRHTIQLIGKGKTWVDE